MIVTTAQLYKLAYGKYAIGAYNINNLVQTMGLFRGCQESQASFIIQLSKGARKYTDKRMLESIIRTADDIFPALSTPCTSTMATRRSCYDCIDSGFLFVGDDRRQPRSRSRKTPPSPSAWWSAPTFVGSASRRNSGQLGGVEEDIQVDEGHASLTNPTEAVEFVHRTGCDALGRRHRHEPRRVQVQGSASLHFDVIRHIQEKIPGTPIVMHGSSSVPVEEVRRINAAGGNPRPQRARRRRERVPPRRQARGDQDQHRH